MEQQIKGNNLLRAISSHLQHHKIKKINRQTGSCFEIIAPSMKLTFLVACSLWRRIIEQALVTGANSFEAELSRWRLFFTQGLIRDLDFCLYNTAGRRGLKTNSSLQNCPRFQSPMLIGTDNSFSLFFSLSNESIINYLFFLTIC